MIYIKRAKAIYAEKRNTVKNWKGALQGHPAFIVGCGPSLEDVSLDPLLSYFTIGINRVYQKDKFDPTILFWQDLEFWKTEHKKVPKLKAIKFTRSLTDPKDIAYHFNFKSGPFMLPISASTLYGSGASAPLSFELASALGCDPIVFLGTDCKYRKKKTNFYGVNADHKPHTLTRCTKGLNWIQAWDKKGKHKIINCSDNDILPNKMSLEDAIEYVKEVCGDFGQPKGRDFYASRLMKQKC